jgi:hypothetical protein
MEGKFVVVVVTIAGLIGRIHVVVMDESQKTTGVVVLLIVMVMGDQERQLEELVSLCGCHQECEKEEKCCLSFHLKQR